jgi:hypothetical protein
MVAELLPAPIENGTVASTAPPDNLAITLPLTPDVLAVQPPPLSAPPQALTVTEAGTQVTPAPPWSSRRWCMPQLLTTRSQSSVLPFQHVPLAAVDLLT